MSRKVKSFKREQWDEIREIEEMLENEAKELMKAYDDEGPVDVTEAIDEEYRRKKKKI